MDVAKIVLWSVLILPWCSLFFLDKKVVKRFMPVAIFASFLMTLYNMVAFNQKHWELLVSIIPTLKPLFSSGVLGAFLVITIWIFHFTYGKFFVYLLTNIIVDFMFAVFPIHYLFQEKFKIYKLINISPWERYGLFVFLSVVIYIYHKWQEGERIET
ncbi:hypothetical protein FIU87_03725 [Bacillus sp. THAF10]|uniref:hypothetical protein n=1 Tax=Bacillus sp. THAF10 TaxID=2587848 RepID=UPI0012681742|nr:hypothetical protein [Bacillus sp. THAF10]QFT87753.1 hypothetical protein FIU87_03725 [Bacillus sp. THAF10]